MTAETMIPGHQRAAHHDPEAARRAVELAEAEDRKKLAHVEKLHGSVHFTARLVLAAMFIVVGLDKLLNFRAEAEHLFNLDVTDPEFPLAGALVIELVGGALLALGWATRRIAVGLSVYLGGVSLLALAYFPPEFSRLFLIANIGLVGGLLMLAAHGAGPNSLDARKAAKENVG